MGVPSALRKQAWPGCGGCNLEKAWGSGQWWQAVGMQYDVSSWTPLENDFCGHGLQNSSWLPVLSLPGFWVSRPRCGMYSYIYTYIYIK